MNLRRFSAILCLCSMLYGEAAYAWAQLIYYKPSGAAASNSAAEQNARNRRLIESIIRATGGQVHIVRSDQTTTRLAGQGHTVTWSHPVSSASAVGVDTVAHDATIFTGSLINVAFAGQARADSLMRSVRQAAMGVHRTVPTLVIRNNEAALATLEDESNLFGAVDSSGFEQYDSGPGKAFYQKGTTQAALTHAYINGAISGYATGDKRNILFGRYGQYMARFSTSASAGGPACAWCDSLESYADVDTVVMWERQFDVSAGASRMIFAMPYGSGAASDSMANTTLEVTPKPATEGDFSIILASLAYLDSVTRAQSTSGGKVLGDKTIIVAPVVYGGLTRGQRHAWNVNGGNASGTQGIHPSDTSSFYAIIDSLKANGIPVTFAVSVDSASSYARDIIKMKEHPLAKFTPQVWGAVSDTTPTGYAGFPVDVFGRWRRRAAYGDSSHHALANGGADTSIYWLAKRSLNMADSIFGRSRVQRVAVAPHDDWSPRGLTGRNPGITGGIDSVLWALRQAGYVGVVADGSDPDARAFKTHGPSNTNPRGFYNHQHSYSSGKLDLSDFKILAHNGYSIMGGRAQTAAHASLSADSSAAAAGPGLLYVELARIWTGALLDYDDAFDTWAFDQQSAFTIPYSLDNIFRRRVERGNYVTGQPPVVRANIYRLSCADLSGVANGPPAAVGFHTLKAAKNAMDIINRLAGRTVIRFGYPEEIEP